MELNLTHPSISKISKEIIPLKLVISRHLKHTRLRQCLKQNKEIIPQRHCSKAKKITKSPEKKTHKKTTGTTDFGDMFPFTPPKKKVFEVPGTRYFGPTAQGLRAQTLHKDVANLKALPLLVRSSLRQQSAVGSWVFAWASSTLKSYAERDESKETNETLKKNKPKKHNNTWNILENIGKCLLRNKKNVLGLIGYCSSFFSDPTLRSSGKGPCSVAVAPLP